MSEERTEQALEPVESDQEVEVAPDEPEAQAEPEAVLSDESGDAAAEDGDGQPTESVDTSEPVSESPSVESNDEEREDAPAEDVDGQPTESVNASELVSESAPVETDRTRLKATIEAVIYVTDEPLTAQQIASALNTPLETIRELLDVLTAEYSQPDRGLSIREVAGGYKLGTKPEHHEEVRAFVKNLKPPFKLSLAALETLAVIAYKQPVTGPEIMEIRGVQGLGVLKTLIDRKLIATGGRKNVVGKPILYKTTRDFLVQFGLKDLAELPTLKEFEDLGRLALSDGEPEAAAAPPEPKAEREAKPVEVEPVEEEAAETITTESSAEDEPVVESAPEEAPTEEVPTEEHSKPADA